MPAAEVSIASPSLAVAELAAALRPALLRLTRLVRHQRADTSISLTHLSALGTIMKHGPLSAGELAACERVQPPSITKVLAGLDERGLIRREPHPSDKRQAVISVTEAGRALVLDEQQQRNRWLSRRIDTLSADERDLLARVVPILDRLAEQ